MCVCVYYIYNLNFLVGPNREISEYFKMNRCTKRLISFFKSFVLFFLTRVSNFLIPLEIKMIIMAGFLVCLLLSAQLYSVLICDLFICRCYFCLICFVYCCCFFLLLLLFHFPRACCAFLLVHLFS